VLDESTKLSSKWDLVREWAKTRGICICVWLLDMDKNRLAAEAGVHGRNAHLSRLAAPAMCQAMSPKRVLMAPAAEVDGVGCFNISGRMQLRQKEGGRRELDGECVRKGQCGKRSNR
jgi:hypothetical protein